MENLNEVNEQMGIETPSEAQDLNAPTETTPVEEVEEPKKSSSCGKSANCRCSMLFSLFLLIALGVLYYLHFTQKNTTATLPKGEAGTGMILTVNNDSIVAHFELVNILKGDLETESNNYSKEMEQKYQSFQTKLNNYQANVQRNVLTQTQMQNAERDLMKEKEQIEALEARYTEILANKEMSVQKEILDSIVNATTRVNDRAYKADYVFATSTGSAIVCANPTYDITKEVIEELNASYKKSKK